MRAHRCHAARAAAVLVAMTALFATARVAVADGTDRSWARGVFEAKARATLGSCDDAVAALCQRQPCAELPEVVDDPYDRGRLQDRVAVGLLAAGGVTIAAGITLVILNRPIEERIGYGKVELVPVVNTDGGGVAGRGRF